MNVNRVILSCVLVAVLCLAGPVTADIIINQGSTINVNNSVIDMNCTDLIINDGGILDLGTGAMDNLREQVVDSGGQLIDGNASVSECMVKLSGNPIAVEGGANGTYAISLTRMPQGSVTITLTPDSQSVIVSANPVILTDTTPQAITIQAVDDTNVEGDHTSSVSHAITASTSAVYPVGMTVDGMTVSIQDNDSDVIIDPGDGVAVSEAGMTTDTYTIALNRAPTGPLTIRVQADENSQVYNSGLSTYFYYTDLIFNDSTPQTVTVRAIDDTAIEGDHASDIRHYIINSSDSTFPVTMTIDSLTVAVADDDVGLLISESGGSTIVNEGGLSDTITVRLSTIPMAPVALNITTDGQTDVDPVSLTFMNDATALDPQTVTVTAVDDSDYEAEHTGTITLTADGGYGSSSVTVVLGDNDSSLVQGVIAESSGSTDVSEEGPTTDTYEFSLASPMNVVVGISTDGQTVITSGDQLTFTTDTWNIPQTVTVQAVDDGLDEESGHISLITHNYRGCTSGCSSDYDLETNDILAVTISDNDTAGFVVGPVSGNTSENGTTATFTVKLSSEPSGSVAINVISTDVGEGIVSTDILIFNSGNWSTDQTVTVTGVNDDYADGTTSYSVRLSSGLDPDSGSGATSDTTGYALLEDYYVALINTDNDPGILLGTPSGNTAEDGTTAMVRVNLTTVPDGNVVVAVSSSDTGEGVVSPSTLTFTPGDWNVMQMITVTGIDDTLDDGNQTYAVNVSVNASGTTDTTGFAAADSRSVTLVNEDIVYTPVQTEAPFVFSYGYTTTGYLNDEGFKAYVWNSSGMELTGVTTTTPDGSKVPLEITGGDGIESSPYTIVWIPDNPAFDVENHTPGSGDVTYHVVLNLYTDGSSSEPVQTETAVWTDFISEENEVTGQSEARKKMESFFDSNALYICRTPVRFDVSDSASAVFRAMDSAGELWPLTLEIPAISPDYLYLDDSNGTSGGNLRYDPLGDYYSINPDRGDFKALHADDRLQLIAEYITYEDSVTSGGVNLYIEVYDGPNRGDKVRYNPILNREMNVRAEDAPDLFFDMLLNTDADSEDDRRSALIFKVTEQGDGIDGFDSVRTVTINTGDRTASVSTNHLSAFVLQDVSGSSGNCFVSTAETSGALSRNGLFHLFSGITVLFLITLKRRKMKK